jgi:hypothetical protein
MIGRPSFYDAMFRPGGDPYFSGSEALIGLPPFWRTAAVEVEAALWMFAREGVWDPTTAEIAARLNRSQSFVAKGLYALHVILGLINRARRRGRRWIDWVKGLLPSRAAKAKDEPAAAPLSTPPPGGRGDTTTDGRSSSPGSAPGMPRAGREQAAAELVDRACRLIPEATPDWVGAMVAVYGTDWFSRALDRVEEVNRTPGRKRVYRRKFVHATLENWREEGGPPKKPEPVPTAPEHPPTIQETAAEDIRDSKLRAAWDALDEARREEFRAAVRAANHGMADRWEKERPRLFLDLCLAELAAAEPPTPTRRE